MRQEYIDSLTKETIVADDIYDSLAAVVGTEEFNDLKDTLEDKARELGCLREFNKKWKRYLKKVGKKNANIFKGNTTNFTEQPIQLSCGEWIATDNGVYKTVTDSNSGVTTEKFASALPLLITEYIDNVDTDKSKVKLAYRRNGRWKYITVLASVISNKNKVIDLADSGIIVNSNSNKLLVEYLGDLIARNEDIIDKKEAVTHLGWIGDNFIPYDTDFVFDGDEDFKNVFNAVHTKGSSNEWFKYVAALRKNTVLRLVIDTSFASVLLDKLNILPFIIHLWGGTGAGKTVAQAVASSVWGNPQPGCMWRSLNNTVNYCMTLSGFFKNLPVIFDELQTIKDYNGSYDRLIMSLSEGINRGRMSFNKLEKTSSWKCTFIFSGEEAITKDNSGGGTKNRVIEIECTEKLVENGHKVIEFINSNYGHAGKMFIELISGNTDMLKHRYEELRADILSKVDTTEKQAMAMATILLADEFVTAWFDGEQKLTVNDISPYLMSTADVDITQRAWDYTLNLIAVNSARFSKDYNNGEIWGRFDNDNTVLINKSILSRELSAKGYDFDACKRKWSERGLLIKNSCDKFIHDTKCYGLKGRYAKLNVSDNANKVIDINVVDIKNIDKNNVKTPF